MCLDMMQVARAKECDKGAKSQALKPQWTKVVSKRHRVSIYTAARLRVLFIELRAVSKYRYGNRAY